MSSPHSGRTNIVRKPWDHDPSFDRCEAFDEQGNHLGQVWYEKTNRQGRSHVNRRDYLKSLLLGLLALVTGRGA